MFPMLDLDDDLFHHPKTTAETVYSDPSVWNDIFTHATTIERSNKFNPKLRIPKNKNLSKPSTSFASEVPSSTSKAHVVEDEHVEKFQSELQDITKSAKANCDLDDDLFNQSKTTAETLQSDPSIWNDIFTPTTIERSNKFNPKLHIHKDKNLSKPSTSHASEGPSSTSKAHDVVDDEHVENQSERQNITKSAKASCETLHSDPSVWSDIFTATGIERSNKFNPKLRIHKDKNLSKLSTSHASEGPSSTSKAHYVVDDEHVEKFQSELHDITKSAKASCDLDDDFHQSNIMTETLHSNPNVSNSIFTPTTIERSNKFNPKLRIHKDKNLSKPSTSLASESPSSTSKAHDVVDGYSLSDSLPLHNESIDVHCPSFSATDLSESLEIKAPSCFPAYLSEERSCCLNDLEAQSLAENVELNTVEGEHTIDHIEEPNLEEGAPGLVQNDEAGKSSMKVRQGNKKLKTNVGDLASKDQNAENIISEMDYDCGGNGYSDDDMPKQKKRKLSRNSCCRNKNSEVPDSTSNDPPKKRLRHGSSRCKSTRRQVNKGLLEIPEDELDRKQLVIKDLIRLADFKERKSNKEAAVLKNLFANQSVEHEQDINCDDANGGRQQEGQRLNYHSYMRRTPQIRWSKTDTEIFYQAIRQFGTDFAMIQVLFPDRSRQQVKAKFKNEQRKHPLLIADALVHRSKDHSHFEKVIQHLQTLAEQNSKNSASDPTAQSQEKETEM